MIIYSFRKLEPKNRRQEQIMEAFEHNKEMCFNELYRMVSGLMGRNQCHKEWVNLKKQEFIIKTDGRKYQLAKPVKLEQSKYPFKTIIGNGKIQDCEVKYFDLEELPPDMQDSYRKSEKWRANLKNNLKK